MIVAFEGPDGVGKTTLLTELAQEVPWTVTVKKFPPAELIEARKAFTTPRQYGLANLHHMWNWDELRRGNVGKVLGDTMFYDRSWLSTVVYNFDGVLPVKESAMPHVDLFVLVTAPYDSYPKAKGELTSEQFTDKLDTYKEVLGQIETPHIIFDTTKDNKAWILSALSSARSASRSQSGTAVSR